MASRAGNSPAGAGGLKGGDFAGAPAPAFPVALRIVTLSAVLLLAIYTVLTLVRLRTTDEPGAATSARAEVAAVRGQAALAPIEVGAEAAADAFGRDGSEPLNVAEQALRLARRNATAAAVVQDQQVVAQSGASAVSGWRAAAAAAHRSGRALWIGAPQPSAASATHTTYVVASVQNADPAAYVILAADPARVLGPVDGSGAWLATADGAILAASGADAGAASLAALGVDPAQAAAGETVRLRAGGRLATASSPDGTLIAGVRAQGGAGGRPAEASNLFALLAPLAIGCGLIVVLMLQSRRTETMQTQQGERERKFRMAVEAARCGIWEWRLRDQQVYMSDITGVMLGWGGGGLVSTDEVMARITPEHRERVSQALRAAGAFGAFDVSFCVARPDGARAWIDARGQAFGQPDAQGYAAVIGVALDVTEERSAEQRAQAAERRLHDAIDSVSEAFVLWDPKGRLLMCNQNYRDFFALEPRVLKPGASRDAVQKVAGLAVRRRLADPDGRRGLGELEMADGRWLQISERRTADGGLVMTAADISAVKRQEEARRLNEEALQNAVDRLEDSSRELSELAEKYQAEKVRAEGANTAKSEFLANMSHELRTPLNAINGFSEMMVNEMFGPLGDPRYRDYAQDILGSGQHLLALINDILDMSKIEAGKLSLNLDWMDVGEVVEDAVRLMRHRAETANLGLDAAITPGMPEIEGDYRAVKQVLLNLLSNALKFTPAGGRVEVKAWELGEDTGERRVRISVSDTGIGIASADIARLGRPFEQIETQHSKTQQGTGLGLALSRSLIEMHGGVFDLTSEPGLGTTVTVTLPVRRAVAVSDTNPAKSATQTLA